ncbi:TetR/AcrR family transcriptional regulator [Actinomadura spongiicola]|uniref:TetR/AcrR family transcriptional regulator n=1 Tax=Actinomadura spongiicola TaxID=2303421 RepID=A0A372GHD9_9ACTN|nr:TetR/AcrR family transcriptional regulator [Actinomadura spongiicola]RFS84787.1 TetR/AcrR family transcriptional regulator [Actinomadura spongiicola]
MARPRKFEEGRAVEAAMRAFWADGYEATSTQTLCEVTGLGRSSIYNTFRSKHDLFEKALTRYMDSRTANIIEVLEDGTRPVRERLRTILEWAVRPDADDPAGCLVVNTMVEMAPRDEATAERLERDLRRRLAALTAAIEEGMRAGEIDAGKDARTLAHFVVTTVSGMRVAARGGADERTLAAIADTAMDAI